MSETSSSELFRSAIVCDALFPYLREPRLRPEDLQIFADAGFTYVSLTRAVDNMSPPLEVVSKLARDRRVIRENPDTLVLVETAEDIRRAKREGKLAIGFHFQGSEVIAREVDMIGAYYALGVRSMILAYNFQNNIGTGCLEERDSGLSAFGRRAILEMNKVGMFVDLSHCGYRTSMEAMDVAESPCIFSHSLPFAIYEHPRNIKDDQIKRCAELGGTIGINGVGAFLNGEQDVSSSAVMKHILYLADLVGPEKITIGLDYIFDPSRFEALHLAAPANYGMLADPPFQFVQPGDIEGLAEAMLSAGMSEKDVLGVLGENYLKMAEVIWK